MSDELHYWHETDDPHRIKVNASKSLDDFGAEWEPHLYTPPDIWWKNGRPVFHSMPKMNFEPDITRTPYGETRLVGLSAVPSPPDPSVTPTTVKGLFADTPKHSTVQRTAANLYAAVTGTPSPELERKALEESVGNKIREMQADMARLLMQDLDSAMLYGNPYHSETEFIRHWKPSRWFRFKLWVRRQYWRVRDLFVRDDEDYDE